MSGKESSMITTGYSPCTNWHKFTSRITCYIQDAKNKIRGPM